MVVTTQENRVYTLRACMLVARYTGAGDQVQEEVKYV